MSGRVGTDGQPSRPDAGSSARGALPPVLELTLPAEPASVPQIRAALREFAAAHGADGDVLGSLALAVSEAATNAVIHAFVGRDPGVVRAAIRTGADELIVHIADNGRGMRPRADSPGMGIGLPTIGQLTSTLDIRQGPEGGTEVRMTLDAPGILGPAEPAAATGEERIALLGEVARVADGAGWPTDGVEALIDLLVPACADVCALDLLRDDGTAHRVAGRVHGDRELSAWLAGRPPQTRYPPSPTYGALDDVAPKVVELTDEIIAAAALDAEDLVLLRRLPARWWMTVPLREGERAHGVLHLGLSAGRGRPSGEDLAFSELVAEHATRGLANTQLIGELRRTRRRLEQILGALTEAVTVHDSQGRIVYANAAAVRLLGAAGVEEVLAARPGELAARFQITREDGSVVRHRDLPGHRLVGGHDTPPLLTRSVHLASGRERWLLTRSSLLDEEGPLAVNIIEDVTDAHIAGRRQRFLTRVSRLLIGIPGADLPQRVADLAVEDLADWCTVELMGDDGRPTTAAVAHRDPARLALAREIDRRWPQHLRIEGGGGALPYDRAVVVPELTDEMLAARARDDEHLRMLQEVGLRSVVLAPLRTPEGLLGRIALISAESSHSFDEVDRDFLVDVADRMAAALQARAASQHS